MRGFLVAFGLAYLLILILFRVFERRLIFFPDYPDRLAGDWQPKGLAIEDVRVLSTGGIKLHAWWIPSERAEFTFVAFHGNAGNIALRAEVYRFLHSLPANVLAIEYRGYGRSEGSPGEEGLYQDAQAAYEYLTNERGIAPGRIVSYGQSLGTAVAVDLAARREVAGLVLEAPFPSARAVARRFYWFVPGVEFVAMSRFDTAGKLARVRVPVLIVHCARDPVLPFSFGQEVFARAREPKTFWRVEGECHEEASLVAPGEYREQLLAFLGRIEPRI